MLVLQIHVAALSQANLNSCSPDVLSCASFLFVFSSTVLKQSPLRLYIISCVGKFSLLFFFIFARIACEDFSQSVFTLLLCFSIITHFVF